jgi:hypothetical protein
VDDIVVALDQDQLDSYCVSGGWGWHSPMRFAVVSAIAAAACAEKGSSRPLIVFSSYVGKCKDVFEGRVFGLSSL